MAKIELNTYDLQVTTTKDGDKVCQIRPALAFNDDFINEMSEMGVQEYVKEEKEEN